MAAAFTMAGFDCIDIHMQDLMDQIDLLKKLNGLALVGGFSYGDVLGAGSGWANTILFNNKLKDSFSAYFLRMLTTLLLASAMDVKPFHS